MALLDTVTKSMVVTLLGERPVALVDSVYTDSLNVTHAWFDDFVAKRGARVAAVVGANPTNTAVAQLAAQCIAYGVAAEFEYAAYPEQQMQGGGGRGYWLDQQFEKQRQELREMLGAGASDALPLGVSRSSFPNPLPFPDPAIQFPSEPSFW